MTARQKSDVEVAVQYLTWALEEIEKLGRPKSALHASIALEELRNLSANKTDKHATMYAEEANRFLDKADETVSRTGQVAATPPS